MSKFENSLITRILDTGDWKSASKVCSTDHFFLPEPRAAWSWIKTFVSQNGVPPSREIFSDSIRNFPFIPSPDPVAALAVKVHEHWVYNQAQLFFDRCAQLGKDDPIGCARYIAENAGRFRSLAYGGESSTLVDITQCTQDEIAAYYQRRDCKGILGLPWPWPRLNTSTFGIMDGQLNIFYARPKSMKTWLLLYCLMYAHYMHGRRPLIFTREMPPEDLRRRWCALFSGIDYGRYMLGQLTTGEERRFLESMEAFSEQVPVLIDTVQGVGAEAAEAMLAKCDEVQPDILGVDGIYFYGDREWDLIAKFTSTLKRGLLDRKIPCLATTQGAKKKSDSGDDVAYSDSIFQDADCLIKVALVEEDQRLYISVPGLREGKECRFSVWAKPATDFSQAFAEDVVPDSPPMDEDTDYVQAG